MFLTSGYLAYRTFLSGHETRPFRADGLNEIDIVSNAEGISIAPALWSRRPVFDHEYL